MQHGAGAGIEWVAVIKCVGCGMQHPCTHAPPVGNLYPNSEKLPKRVENPSAAGWKSLPKQRKSAEKGRETPVPPFVNLYPNSGK